MTKQNAIMLWESRGYAIEGIPTPAELEKTPGFCGYERLKKGPVAVIECTQEIPCNPCELACRKGAIKVGNPITNLPILDYEECTGCGLCISSCPGLAIFGIDLTFSDEDALVSLPYEYLHLPEVGTGVEATDREGKVVCQGKVVKVLNRPEQGFTGVLYISIPQQYALLVRGVTRRIPRKSEAHEDLQRRISHHPILGEHKPAKKVLLTVDNKKITAREGEVIESALLSAGIRTNRYTTKYKQPRGFFCAIGQCTDCIMTVNGIPNIRTCVTLVEEGMVIETQYGTGKRV